MSSKLKFLFAFISVLFVSNLVGCNDAGKIIIAVTKTPMPTLGINSTMIREKDGMEMVYVPEGSFTMGDFQGQVEEQPEHEVHLDAFWIDKYEVSNHQFHLFVEETDYITEGEIAGEAWAYVDSDWRIVEGASWHHPGGPESDWSEIQNHPVVSVSWSDAFTYCEWVGGSLPTEAQWEKAARGTDERIYPWGNEPVTDGIVNFADQNLSAINWANMDIDDGYETTSPVGSFLNGVSPYGALDMAGNVWEWVSDWYDEKYYENSPLENPAGPEKGKFRILRGGSWCSDASLIRTTYRENMFADSIWSIHGFRCVYPVTEQ